VHDPATSPVLLVLRAGAGEPEHELKPRERAGRVDQCHRARLVSGGRQGTSTDIPSGSTFRPRGSDNPPSFLCAEVLNEEDMRLAATPR
jgi:hypothetical protein